MPDFGLFLLLLLLSRLLLVLLPVVAGQQPGETPKGQATNSRISFGASILLTAPYFRIFFAFPMICVGATSASERSLSVAMCSLRLVRAATGGNPLYGRGAGDATLSLDQVCVSKSPSGVERPQDVHMSNERGVQHVLLLH
jgi:hypothetical protein